MPIHCDVCHAPIAEAAAIVMSDEDGELFYFCTEECVLAARELEPSRELERVESAT